MGDYIFFSIGIIIVIISIIVLKKNMSIESTIEFQNSEKKEIALLNNIELTENIIKELKAISQETIKTLDNKTEEIYQMIKILDEKIEKYSIVIDETDKNENNRQIRSYSKKEDAQNIKKEDHASNNNKDKEKILQLYNQGYSPSQIAKKLNKGIGEVQLICSLKKR
ncbi:DUF6115 domain-containing protein [Crassaminicella profunda]|uniref:DUF6115 domain-containing protein n=1 Tax=Crassaminicella profunda TaxID=1286698 RepID=UPI001CA714D0|nr:hypothetical protein [Crassaminicella profunda]QZY56779.1 hypothetical protein K7H06_07610 [Crassaminicella profunda]